MLFLVRMDVHPPLDDPQGGFARLKAAEKALAEELQRSGKWRHLWRIAGQYANFSVFDVADADELHAVLIGLPLFPYMTTEVTSLCRHPSALAAD
ncbi:MAG: muconolactone Delta-isomerase [Novosphingobium sp.]